MKKIYEAPRAEKLEFDYTETVLASGSWDVKDNYEGCNVSYKDASGVCGYNGRHTSNPTHECGSD